MSIEPYSFPESTLQAFRDETFPRLRAYLNPSNQPSHLPAGTGIISRQA